MFLFVAMVNRLNSWQHDNWFYDGSKSDEITIQIIQTNYLLMFNTAPLANTQGSDEIPNISRWWISNAI